MTVGADSEGGVEIREGLSENDRIAATGAFVLKSELMNASGMTETAEVPVLEEADGWKVCFSEGYRLPGA